MVLLLEMAWVALVSFVSEGGWSSVYSRLSTVWALCRDLHAFLRPSPFYREPPRGEGHPQFYGLRGRRRRWAGLGKMWSLLVQALTQVGAHVGARVSGIPGLPAGMNILPEWWSLINPSVPRRTMGNSVVEPLLRRLFANFGRHPWTPDCLSLRPSKRELVAQGASMEAYYRRYFCRACSPEEMAEAGRLHWVFEVRLQRADGFARSPTKGLGLLSTPEWGTSPLDDHVREHKRGQMFFRKWRNNLLHSPLDLKWAVEAQLNAFSSGVLRCDPWVDRQLFIAERYRNLLSIRDHKEPYFLDASARELFQSLQHHIRWEATHLRANWGVHRPNLRSNLRLGLNRGNCVGVAGWGTGPSPEMQGLVYHWSPWSGCGSGWILGAEPTKASLIPRGFYYEPSWWPEELGHLQAKTKRRLAIAMETFHSKALCTLRTKALCSWPNAIGGGLISSDDVHEGAAQVMREVQDLRSERIWRYSDKGEEAVAREARAYALKDPAWAARVEADFKVKYPDLHAAQQDAEAKRRRWRRRYKLDKLG